MDVAGSAIIKLNDSNYQLWKHQLKLLLRAKKAWSAIENEKPETNVKEIEAYEDKSALAASIILGTLEPTQAQQVINLDEGKEIWEKLQQIHEGKVASRRVDLRMELSTIKMKDDENVEQYLGRAQYLRSQLEQCNSAITNEEFIGLLLNGLPNSYRAIRVQMKATGLEKISLDEFRSGLKDQEDELKLTEIETKMENACMSRGNEKFNSKKQKSKPNVNCWICNKRGHYARECYHRADKKQEKQEKANTASSASGNESARESAMNVTEKEKTGHYIRWYLDSGATSHMTSNKTLFTQINYIDNNEVKMADGNLIKVKGTETVRVRAGIFSLG